MSANDGKPRRRRLSAQERALWDKITRSVAPLRPSPALAQPSTADEPSPQAFPLPRAGTRATSLAAEAEPQLEQFDRRLRQRLARGSVSIDARIDLHGRTQREAHAALRRFLDEAQDDGAKLVLVITGKGARAGSSERGVLRRQVPLWLKLPEFRAYVIGFEAANAGHGGEGALYVRLRRARRAR